MPIQKNKKNALIELYYNLSLEVLSDEYEQAAVYTAISDLTAEISTNLQKAIRSSKLKRELEEEKNKKIKK